VKSTIAPRHAPVEFDATVTTTWVAPTGPEVREIVVNPVPHSFAVHPPGAFVVTVSVRDPPAGGTSHTIGVTDSTGVAPC
jgi:hypothetical protein